jgi:hypothetical protein
VRRALTCLLTVSAIHPACSGAASDSDRSLLSELTTTAAPPSTEAPTATSMPVAPTNGAEESTEKQAREQAQPAPLGREAFEVIDEFIDAWKARDAAGMAQASASDLPYSDIQWLIDLGTPAGEPYECRQWEDDDGPVAQCYIEVPDHGQYDQKTHYVLARSHADGTWEVTWAAVLTNDPMED